MSRSTSFGALIVTIVCASLAPQAFALRVNYAVDVVAERNSNLQLTPNDPIALTVLRPGVGFEIFHDTSVLQAHISGRAEYRRYGDSRFEDSVDGTLNGSVNWVAIPERLSFSAVDSLTVQPVNTLGADTPGNRQQVNVLSAGPTLHFEWGDGWRGTAEMRYVRSQAEITSEFDSRRTDLAVRASRKLSASSRLAFNVQSQRVDFDTDVVARDYTRSEVFARYSRTLNRVDFSVDLGYSHLAYRRDLPGFAGARSDPMLRTELSWRPNESHRLDMRYSSQFSDVAADSLAAIGEDAELPSRIATGDTVVNASPFIERRLEGEYTWTSTRWTLSLTPFADRLRYQDTDEFDQNGYGLGLEASFRPRRDLRLGVAGSLDNNRYLNLDREDETRRYNIFARYDRSRHWSAMLTLSRYERRSDAAGQNADQNVAMLTLTYRNR